MVSAAAQVPWLGIEVGNSTVTAYVWTGKGEDIVCLRDSDKIMPAVVTIDKDGKILTGIKAAAKAKQNSGQDGSGSRSFVDVMQLLGA